MRYRAEIDGLRAVAVVPVVLYHAHAPGFAGGYVGVDVFFVVSGYLITGLLASELAAGEFSVATFYERRARRILPALFVVLAATVAAAWRLFLPEQLKTLGQGIAAAALFVANLFLHVRGHDYFGLHADQDPVLHLWSLSVEEQYYLLFPLLLALGWRRGRRFVLGAVAAVALASLAWSWHASTAHPSAGFYLLPSRAWEILLGAVLALAPAGWHRLEARPAAREALTLAGLALIGGAVLALDARTPFPGAWALLPTVGTALVVAFADPASGAGRLLASGPLVGLGLVSYGVYLWHLPLFVLYRAWNYREPGPLAYAVLSLVALALAAATYRLVERPLRDRRRLSRRTVFALALAGSAAFATFGILGQHEGGFPDRDPLFGRLASNFGLAQGCNGNAVVSPECSTRAAPELAVLGNSYAMHLVEGLRAAYPQRGVVQLTVDRCEPYLTADRTDPFEPGCVAFLARALATVRATPSIRTVFVSSPFRGTEVGENLRSFERTLAALRAEGRRVVVVGPAPTNGSDHGKCFVRHRRDGDLAACDFARASVPAEYFEKVRRVREVTERQGATFVDLSRLVCEGERCRASIAGTLIYRDEGHLSREGSRYVFARIAGQGAR